jgi:hypothetical protein
MSSKTQTWLDDKVLERLEYCIANGVIKRETIEKQRDKFSDLDDRQFYRSILRKLGIENFLAYAAIINFDIFASPSIYPDIIKKRMYSTKPIFFLMIPRGTWKSVLMLAGFEEWKYLQSRTLGNKQAINVCFIHGNIDRATSDLDTVKQHVKSDFVQYIYGDIFKITTDNATQLDFEDTTSPIPLKDCAFEVGSVDTDLAGKHYSRLALDDFATEKNCATPEMNEKNKRSFSRLFSLADRVEGRIMAIDYIGTPYLHGSITEELHLGSKWDKWCDRIVIPASHSIPNEDGSLHEIYPFHQLPKDQMDMYKETLPPEEYMSQYYMQYYDREEGMPAIENLPEYYDPFDEKGAHFSPVEWCGLLVDPANAKKTRNRKSLMVILVAAVTEKRELFVVDGCFLKGVTPSEFRDRMEGYARNYPIDDAVIESIAAQEYMANDIKEQSEMGGFSRYFRIIKHRHYDSKQDHYRAFLEPLFRRKIVRVNPELHELIDELAKKSSFDDGIDCLSFIKELRFSFVTPAEEKFENESDRKWSEIKKCQKKLHRRPAFSIVTPWI